MEKIQRAKCSYKYFTLKIIETNTLFLGDFIWPPYKAIYFFMEEEMNRTGSWENNKKKNSLRCRIKFIYFVVLCDDTIIF